MLSGIPPLGISKIGCESLRFARWLAGRRPVSDRVRHSKSTSLASLGKLCSHRRQTVDALVDAFHRLAADGYENFAALSN